jgi:hypothetical protein
MATLGLPAAPPLWAADSEPPVLAALTLDERITKVWVGLAASTVTSCPVCAADMTPRWSAGAGVVGGRCGGCGSTLE